MSAGSTGLARRRRHYAEADIDLFMWSVLLVLVQARAALDLRGVWCLLASSTNGMSNGSKASTSQLRFRTAREIAEATPVRPAWIVEGMLVAGAITEVDGKAKIAGKTTFIGFQVRAVLEDEHFLGRTTHPGPVVWLTEERSASFRQMLQRCHLEEHSDLFVLEYADTIGTDWAEVVRQAREVARKHHAVELVVDTLPRFAGLAGDEENSAGAAMIAMDPLVQATGDGLAVLVSRHDRRSGGEVAESGRGSTAFTGSVDIVLHLSRLGGEGRANVRQLDGIGRFDGIPDRLVIELGDDGYQPLGSESDLRLKEAKAQLLEHLPESEEEAVTLPSLWAQAKPAGGDKPATPAGPLADSKVSPNTFRRAAEALVEAGIVAQRVISARKTVWWCVSHARGALAHTLFSAPTAFDDACVSRAPIHIDGARRTHTHVPESPWRLLDAHGDELYDLDSVIGADLEAEALALAEELPEVVG